jgi:hypothetical protein
VVQRHEHDVFGLAEAQQPHPEGRPAAEVERPSRLFGGQALGLCFRVLPAAQVFRPETHRPGGVDELPRLPVDLDEAGAQRLVAAHDLGQRALQRRPVEPAADSHRQRHVVDGAAGRELVDKPQPRLREREGKIIRSPVATDNRQS